MIDYTLFGESHGEAVGILLRGVPAGLQVDEAFIHRQLLRRMAQGSLATARREADRVEFLSGVFQGKTTGMPLVALIRNRDAHPQDYEQMSRLARPGHADYAAFVKSGGCNDYRGGGHFSGRLTAPLVAAGGMVQSWLKEQNIVIKAQVIDEMELRQRTKEAKANGDSVGGRIGCTVTGVSAGWGGPDWYEAVESELARHLFAIPGVKAVAFGAGEAFAEMRGSEANDPFYTDGERIFTRSNHSGGINGGITNGMPLVFTVTFRPTPSIALEQETVNFRTMENATISVKGRHDPCIALRAAPVVEAAAALALVRLLDEQGSGLDAWRHQIDDIDRELVSLLEKRWEIAGRIGAYKKERQFPIEDRSREEEVLHSRSALAPGHCEAIEAIWREIMHWSREEQK